MDTRQIMEALAEAYWKRPAVEAELVAMIGELTRDAEKIAGRVPAGRSDLFGIEPSSFDAVLLSEVTR
ncbi:hypothetical protein [Rhizobium glycinendophyticum]|uniref:Uncharacterized protein n=1 Tax=Rhizobium glycinendophyticum TaxID=2589807 RepID=A0A504TWU1_9HYPH|nr:hypothetical protein [Rhizobium glycinendophyticum]TPP05930.1 hypothetical protein FJQ55_19520 [Rhizobium glycinendophyticum]